MKNILCIIDDKVDIEKLKGFARRKEAEYRPNFCICPITVNIDLVHGIRNDLSKYAHVEILPFVKEFHKNAFSYKNSFVKFMSDFSRYGTGQSVSIIQYFMHPFKNFSLWWLSLIREKCTFKKRSYHNLIKLITIIDFKSRYDASEIYVDIEDRALARAVLRNKGNDNIYLRKSPKKDTVLQMTFSLVKVLGYILFFVLRKCMLYIVVRADKTRKMSILANSKFILVTPFPFADEKKMKINIFRNEFLGSLQKGIEKEHKHEVSFVGIPHQNMGLNIKEIKCEARINTWGYCLFMPEELISFREIAGAISVFCYICLKYIVKLPYLSQNFLFDYKNGVNIWDLFEDEWRYSFFGSYLIKNMFYYHAFSNIANSVTRYEASVIYPFELFAWENALNIACMNNAKIKTVGIQHTSVPVLILNYFNAPDELKGDGSVDALPMPDYIAASGSIPRKLFIENGWPRERVFDLGAVRYHKLSKYIDENIPWASRKKQVVVALSSMQEEVREILLLLWQAVRDKDICPFVIKSHLLCSAEDVAKSIGIENDKANFIFDADTPLEDLLVSSRAVIVAGSTASIDGVACQCPVIIPRLSCMVDLNPLSNISSELARYVANKEELTQVVRSIVDSDTCPIESKSFESFISDYFTILGDEDEYFSRLNEKLRGKI